MCGRFKASFEFHEIKVRWNLQNDLLDFQPRFNIAPSQNHPIVIKRDGVNEARSMRWGLVPWWAKDQSIGNKLINARAETLTEKASFKRLLGLRRCLVPANAFYEWRKEGKQKTPMLIRLKGDETFAFAGLWETWRKPDGNLLESFTIITCAPNELTKTIHDRVVRVLSRHRRSPFRSATFA